MRIQFSRGASRILTTLFLTLVLLSAVHAQPAVEYVVSLDGLKNHTMTVKATFPPEAFVGERRELALAVWTPGSYKVRDYSRFLSEVRLLNQGATIEKTSKTRWLVKGVESGEPIRLEYDVYGHEMTVRTNYFTPELSLVVGAATFLAPAPLQSDEMKALPYAVEFVTGDPVYSGLAKEGSRFVAADYLELVDSPFLLGDLQSHPFTAGGLPHLLVQGGDYRYWDTQKSLRDTAKLLETIQDFWGSVPYDRYLILNLITGARGGLEHRNSTVVVTNRFATQKRKDYLSWLSLISHEYFHTWNIKQLRPRALRPFDLENENYTRSLWVAEGITSYYDDLLVRKAGLSTREEYLEALSLQLNDLQQTPGRRHITLADSSFDAWIRHYQPTDDLHNSNISYYNKGAVVGWLLDTEIRKHTSGKKSLDDLMRQAYTRFQKDGFTEAEFQSLASEVAGADLGPFFRLALDSTEELPLEEALNYWQLTWKPKDPDLKPTLGIELSSAGRAVISKVFKDSPAARAGLAPGDELIAIDDTRFPQSSPLSLLEQLQNGREYRILYSRLGQVSEKTLVLELPAHPEGKLAFRDATREAKAKWDSWLGPESKP
ncbi:MAG: PDZ domain-containing protein [Vulcanimicrobiota bacterium]